MIVAFAVSQKARSQTNVTCSGVVLCMNKCMVRQLHLFKPDPKSSLMASPHMLRMSVQKECGTADQAAFHMLAKKSGCSDMVGMYGRASLELPVQAQLRSP